MTTAWKKPQGMNSLDMNIAVTECHNRGLVARRAYMSQHPRSSAKGFDSPAYKAQQTAMDRCMAAKGLKMTRRVRSG